MEILDKKRRVFVLGGGISKFAAERADFVRAIKDIPEILECYTVFGEMDAMLKVLAPDAMPKR